MYINAIDPWFSHFGESEVLSKENEMSLVVVNILQGKSFFMGVAVLNWKCYAFNCTAFPSETVMSGKICFISELLWILFISVYCSYIWSRSNFLTKSISQVALFAIRTKTTYSTYIEDNTDIAYLFDYQLIEPPLSINIKPEVDLLVA